MTIRYCTCAVQSKETFPLYGFIGNSIFLAAITYLAISIIEEQPYDMIVILVAAILVITEIIFYYDYRRNALKLGHSQPCANRYALLATASTIKGIRFYYRQPR